MYSQGIFSWGCIAMGKFLGAASVGEKNADSGVPHPSPHLDHHYSLGRMRRKGLLQGEKRSCIKRTKVEVGFWTVWENSARKAKQIRPESVRDAKSWEQ
jgi:hypothetical protein